MCSNSGLSGPPARMGSDPLQSQLVHQVDLVTVSQILPHEGLHGEGEGGGVGENLPAGGQVLITLLTPPASPSGAGSCQWFS